ncbi:MAG: hypothetical protein K2N37_06850, partial [Lachnospiraceae bacterium]|nr:hypothetical protein [Lachnospiraceae bacterium]
MKRKLAVLMTGAMVMATLAGCGGNDAAPAAAPAAAEEAPAAEEEAPAAAEEEAPAAAEEAAAPAASDGLLTVG